MKRRLQLLLSTTLLIGSIFGGFNGKVEAAWVCPEGTNNKAIYNVNPCPTGQYYINSTDCSGSDVWNLTLGSTSVVCVTGMGWDVTQNWQCDNSGSGVCYGFAWTQAYFTSRYVNGVCEAYSASVLGNPTGQCTWVNVVPTVTVSVSNPSTWVKTGDKLNISGTITDPDSQNYTVSYSLSTTTTPGVWTVCRSASSTKKCNTNIYLC